MSEMYLDGLEGQDVEKVEEMFMLEEVCCTLRV